MVSCKYNPIPRAAHEEGGSKEACMCSLCNGCDDSERICDECTGQENDVMLYCSEMNHEPKAE